MPPRVLRIFRFRLATPDLDAQLREILLPELRRLPGMLDAYGGRRDQPMPDERIIVSIWADRPSMVASVSDRIEDSPFHPELLGLSTDRRLDIGELACGDKASDAPAAVLRVVDGAVRAGELDAYLSEAEDGMRADRAAGHGPIAFYLARGPDDTFTTVSTWPDWATIGEATGGDIHRPTATRRAERLTGWTVSHYEVVAIGR